MQTRIENRLPSVKIKNRRICLACGDTLPPRHRRYCSTDCRQHLLISLNRRTGLLRALNTRYATFSFTEFIIMMDLLPYGSERIHSYILPRSPGKKPMDDFCELCNILGTAWWKEKNRTKKRYLATRHILEQAANHEKSKDEVIPSTLVVPSVRADNLISLELRATDLTLANIETCIKSAFRRQAKKHHPDMGGNTHTFRKIQEAYEKLLNWAQHPTFSFRSGFPEKWLYEGSTCRWIQPTMPHPAWR
jgi:hypothetical protein